MIYQKRLFAHMWQHKLNTLQLLLKLLHFQINHIVVELSIRTLLVYTEKQSDRCGCYAMTFMSVYTRNVHHF